MSHGLATLATALAGFGLTWAVQSSALLVVGLLAGRVLRRSGPAVQSAVYRTTLAAVLVCPLTSTFLAAAGYDGLTLRLPAPTTGETLTVDPLGVALASASPAHVVTSVTSDPMALKGASEASESALSPAEPTRRQPLISGVSAIPQPAPASLWIQEAAAVAGLSVWLLGAMVMGARLLIGHLRMTRLRATALAAEPGAGVLCRELAERMGVSSPAVLKSPFLFSPCLDGLWRPAILLPDDVGGSLRDTFVHELAHLARRDGLWNLLRRSSVAVLWVQPLLWILSKRLEGAAEEVCDDYVVQFGADRTRYAGHLLELARRTLPPSAPAGVGMVSLRSMLSRRIVRLLDTSRSLSTRAGKRTVLAMLVAGLAGTLLAGLLVVDGRQREAKAQEPAKAVEVKDGPGRPEDDPAAKAARPDVPISGRIVDLEGRPIAGVSVRIRDFRTPKSGDLSTWLVGIKRGEPPWIAGQHIDWNRKAPAASVREATTDADGRFRLEGLGAECLVELTLQGETMAATRIEVATRKMDPIPARGFRNQHGPGFQSIHGADFTFTAAPSRPIEGVIKEAKTGRPVADMEVRSNRFAGSDFVGTMTLKTKTDAQGRFRLSGMPKGEGNELIVVPDDEQPYLVQGVDVPDAPGVAPVSVEVSLPRGIWIEGRLTEKATGTPVVGAWLHYMPFLENTFAQAHPSFDRHGNSDNSDIQDRYLTKADGSFRLVGLPGRAIVGALVHKKAYLQGVGSEAIAGLNKGGPLRDLPEPDQSRDALAHDHEGDQSGR